MSIIEIGRGEDVTLPLWITLKKRPQSLQGLTTITVEFKTQDGGTLQKTNKPVEGVAASVTSQGVLFTADNEGVAGDSISLVFNGTDTLDAVVGNWNTINPNNTVNHGGVGSSVLTADTVNLTGGKDPVTYVNVIGSPDVGNLSVYLNDSDTESLRLGKLQTFRAVLEWGDAPEGIKRYAYFRNCLTVESTRSF